MEEYLLPGSMMFIVGEYQVVPKAFEQQVLPTSNRVLKEDVVVREVPFYEVSNESDGVTAYIGKDMGNGL